MLGHILCQRMVKYCNCTWHGRDLVRHGVADDALHLIINDEVPGYRQTHGRALPGRRSVVALFERYRLVPRVAMRDAVDAERAVRGGLNSSYERNISSWNAQVFKRLSHWIEKA